MNGIDMSSITAFAKGIAMAAGVLFTVFGIVSYTGAKGSQNDDLAIKAQWNIIRGLALFAVGISPIIERVVGLITIS